MHRRDLFKLLSALPFVPGLAKSSNTPDLKSSPRSKSVKDICPAVLDELANRQKNGPVSGLTTGFNDLDSLTGGFHAGDLIVIGGRPSMGKSTLALNIAANLALNQDKPQSVGYFSMYATEDEVTTRLISSISRTPMPQLYSGDFTDDKWPEIIEANQKLSQAPLFIEDTPAQSDTSLYEQAISLKAQTPDLSLIVIDEIQLMHTDRVTGDRSEELAVISHSLKELAQKLQVPVIVISQLSRSVEERSNKRPIIRDLGPAIALGQNADLVLFLYRDEIYNPENLRKDEAEIIVARNRRGRNGSALMSFEGKYATFRNYVPDFSGWS